MIETNSSVVSISTPVPKVSTTIITTPNHTKFTSLKDLQERYKKDNINKKQIVSITAELLDLCKQEFIDILSHKRDPSLLAFQQMKIIHKENNQIELLTDMMFNKHFLDEVKDEFHTLLENKFKQSIILSIQVDESLQTEKIANKEVKNQFQLFEELAEKYPLLKILKEKLDLSIE